MANKKRKNKIRKSTKAQPSGHPSAIPEGPLSDKWYNNVEICEVLGMSISSVKRRRRDGSLIASKKFGKICFNAYHVEQFLKGGLPKMVTGVVFLLNSCLEGVAG